MDLDQLRRLALALPETSEQPHFHLVSFRIRTGILATADPDGTFVRVFLDPEVARGYAEELAGATEVWWGQRLTGVELPLAGADPAIVTELLTEAWRRRAPKRLRSQYDPGAGGSPG